MANNQTSHDSNLLEGESPIHVNFHEKIKLTTHRLRFENSQQGGKILSSIFLDSISLIQLKSKKQIYFAVIGFIFILLAILAYIENYLYYTIISTIAGIILFIFYIFYELNVIVIYSKGIGKIEFPPSSSNRKQNIEFINTIESAIYNFKINKPYGSILKNDGNTIFRKEDFY